MTHSVQKPPVTQGIAAGHGPRAAQPAQEMPAARPEQETPAARPAQEPPAAQGAHVPPAAQAAHVVAERLSFAYPGASSPVLRGLSFTMRKSEIVGVLGPSGCGKSTLLRLLAGLEMPSSGRIEIGGRTVFSGGEFGDGAAPGKRGVFVPPEARGVGMVFQDWALFPHLNVARNIAFGLHRLPRAERRERVRRMLELVRLEGLKDRYPHELSGGQQQRVALARALAPGPELLLLDEPFSNLDADLRAAIREELLGILKQTGTTCLLVTHDRQDVQAICDRTILLGAGAAAHR